MVELVEVDVDVEVDVVDVVGGIVVVVVVVLVVVVVAASAGHVDRQVRAIDGAPSALIILISPRADARIC